MKNLILIWNFKRNLHKYLIFCTVLDFNDYRVSQKHTNWYAKVRVSSQIYEILVLARLFHSRFSAHYGFEKFLFSGVQIGGRHF